MYSGCCVSSDSDACEPFASWSAWIAGPGACSMLKVGLLGQTQKEITANIMATAAAVEAHVGKVRPQ